MSYLITRNSVYPFTAADIRADLGLAGREMDPVIEAGIAMLCGISQKPVTRTTWLVAESDDPNWIGVPVEIGEAAVHPATGNDTRPHRLCTYAAAPAAVEAVRLRILRWCMNQHDIAAAIRNERSAAAVFSPARVGELAA